MKWLVAILLLWTMVPSARGDDSAKPDAAKEPELRRELLERFNADQDARKALIGWIKEHGSDGSVTENNLSSSEKAEYQKLLDAVGEEDKENMAWLREVIEKHGWPTNSMVGRDGANAAWLLVQHADADAKFQRKCLDLMAELPKGEVSQMDFAYLTDRVLLAEGKKQIYGTQFETVDGKMRPRPLEDEANVDKRRAEVGLEPIAEYAKSMAELYQGKK